MLPVDAGSILCRIARDAIATAVAARADIVEPGATPAEAAWLDEPGATFVTLTRDGGLRGCLGTLAAWRPLRIDVAENAAAAATRDSRFPPVAAHEIANLNIEVSVLSVPEHFEVTSRADALARLQPFVDGVTLTYGRHRGTFLPQVWEQLPDPSSFLAQLLRKAGLAEGWWDPGVRLERYTVTAFHEHGDRQ